MDNYSRSFMLDAITHRYINFVGGFFIIRK